MNTWLGTNLPPGNFCWDFAGKPTALCLKCESRSFVNSTTAEEDVNSVATSSMTSPGDGSTSRGSQVFVQVVPDCKAETLLGLTVKKVRRGSIVYTDKYKAYDSLMFCGFRHLAVDHDKYFSRGKVCINGLEGFWSFAKERLIKHHGVSRKFFPLYLKELEFRYNYRQQNLFNKICQFLCYFVPDVE